MSDWRIYRNQSDDHLKVDAWLADPPPWRRRKRPDTLVVQPPPDFAEHQHERGANFVLPGGDMALEAINEALLLRRPLLVSGPPGIGKSSLAWSLALRLDLGRVLTWEIGSQTTLQQGLYHYDAVGHLAAIRAWEANKDRDHADRPPPVSGFVTLGPLGTALLPRERPRVLLVDELDKASYDLPNDLLHVFEDGGYEIDELRRAGAGLEVIDHDGQPVGLGGPRVAAWRHPVVVITSNAEREFPPAFLRRCVRLDLALPEDSDERLVLVRQVLAAWFPGREAEVERLATEFDGRMLDRLLAAMHLRERSTGDDAVRRYLDRG